MAAFLITKASVFILANMLQNLPATLDLVAIPFLPLLGFLDTKLTWFASSFFFSTLCLCWLPPKQLFSQNRYHSGISPGSLFRFPLSYSFLEREVLSYPHRMEPALPPRGFRCPAKDHLSLMQQLPIGISGSPAASEEPTRWKQQVKGSENYINTGTRSH